MGQHASLLTAEEIEDLQAQTSFTQKEIKALYRRFMRLDKSETGQISAAEFMSLPEMAMHPLGPRIAHLFKNINFPQFLRVLSLFNHRIVKETEGVERKQLELLFQIYDVDEDGYISESDLRTVLLMLVGDNLTDQQISRTVQRIFSESDLDVDGRLSFEEFTNAFEGTKLQDSMTFDFFADD